MNRCTLLVFDALGYSSLQDWIDRGALPNLARLVRRGGSIKPCSSTFPSVTPTASCSIATGRFPKDHGVEGACWYDRLSNQTQTLRSDFKRADHAGHRDYFADFANQRNSRYLCQPLLFEQLAARGIQSACINYMWFRGPYSHKRQTPWTFKSSIDELSSTVNGPRYLKLGDFVHALPSGLESPDGMVSGILGRYGIHDKTTSACLLALARSGQLPPFSLGYFPLNRSEAHRGRRKEATEICMARFDAFLGKFIDALGGWGVIENSHDLLIVGDHGQSEALDEEAVQEIPLHQILSEYSQAASRYGFEFDEDILICPNMRASAIHLRDESDKTQHQIVESLLSEPLVDQVIYRNLNADGLVTFTVRTAKRGQLTFRRSVHGHSEWKPNGRDIHGNSWSILGETSCLDLRFDRNRRIVEGDYPNALERIEGAFTGESAPIWVTAVPGAAFRTAESNGIGVDSQGSLHKNDSLTAIVGSAGIKWSRLASADHVRLTDVFPLVLASLGILQENAQIPTANGMLAGSPVFA